MEGGFLGEGLSPDPIFSFILKNTQTEVEIDLWRVKGLLARLVNVEGLVIDQGGVDRHAIMTHFAGNRRPILTHPLKS